jgi:hypothetical protein
MPHPLACEARTDAAATLAATTAWPRDGDQNLGAKSLLETVRLIFAVEADLKPNTA